MSKKTDPQKRYWWLIAIVVPIVLAVIGIVPNLIDSLKPKSSPLPEGISITNTNFVNNMYFVTQVTSAGDSAKAQAAQQVIQNATGLVQNKDYANAITQLEQAATQYQYPSIYNNLGVLYANLGEYDKARDAYNRALKLDPNDQAANFNLGLLEQFQGNTSAAQTNFSKAPNLSNTPASSVSVQDSTTPEPTVSTQIPGVTAQLLEFSKFQNTITLKVRLINSTVIDQNICSVFNDQHLLDEASGKIYSMTDQSGPDCGLTAQILAANGSIDLWTKYSIPAEDNPQYISAVLGAGILFEHLKFQ